MQCRFWSEDLVLAHTWTIARAVETGGENIATVLFAEVTDGDGVRGLGEAAPTKRYKESTESVRTFFEKVDAANLSFEDVPGSMAYLETLQPRSVSGLGAINIALLDGAARRAGKAIYEHLGLGFSEDRHVTSFSIGIDSPEMIRRKVAEAAAYPVLKLKLGSAGDRENLAALRQAAPDKTVRVDGNEAWRTKEEALRQIEWLASGETGDIEFIEQPMPAGTPREDLAWLKDRSPLPIMGDESCVTAADIDLCSECYHSVNVKLAKTAGISGAFEALTAARAAGLKTMIGCMIESSVLISAAAHLAELTDYLDIDGNLLIRNDPYIGATAEAGKISFAQAADPLGLRVRRR